MIKAVRPSKIADLHAGDTILYDAGLLVPRNLGADDGVLVMPMLPGTSLRARLRAGAVGCSRSATGLC